MLFQKMSGKRTTTSMVSPGAALSLWSWGYNTDGFLGLGDTTPRSSPVQVGALVTWSAISAGNNHSLATKTDGTLWAWGNNAQGKLGLGNTTYFSSPVQVGTLVQWTKLAQGYAPNQTLALQRL